MPHSTPQSPAGVEPRRKAGFFERLTGRGGRPEGDSNQSQQPTSAAHAPGRQASTHNPADRGQAGGDRGVQKNQEGAELPVFFNRERK